MMAVLQLINSQPDVILLQIPHKSGFSQITMHSPRGENCCLGLSRGSGLCGLSDRSEILWVKTISRNNTMCLPSI